MMGKHMAEKVGECSGEGEEKIGDIQAPPM
jgi:hypothetical protein